MEGWLLLFSVVFSVVFNTRLPCECGRSWNPWSGFQVIAKGSELFFH